VSFHCLYQKNELGEGNKNGNKYGMVINIAMIDLQDV